MPHQQVSENGQVTFRGLQNAMKTYMRLKTISKLYIAFLFHSHSLGSICGVYL